MLPRRALLAAVPAALAGCGGRLRNNPVPGGLVVENGTRSPRTATVRATPLLTPPGTDAGTPTPGEETPDRPPAATTELSVAAGERRTVPDFFPRGGVYQVDALSGDRRAALVVRMYPAVSRSAGVDTVFVEFVDDGLRLSVSTVD